jgi:hypothetical protein
MVNTGFTCVQFLMSYVMYLTALNNCLLELVEIKHDSVSNYKLSLS